MNLISIDSITKWQGDKLLIDGASFGVETDKKIALIGINGCGKTTLLNLLAGLDQPDSGSICRNGDLKISYLRQNAQFSPAAGILEHVFSSGGYRLELIKKYELLSLNAESANDPKFNALIDEMNKSGAWHYEGEVRSVLEKLGITDLNLKMGELSGGMVKKVSLAKTLIEESNLLILDEPTNHLDTDTVEWLEQYLKKTDKTLIMVTHDRYFLDKICNHIIEIENKKLYHFPGNYTYYLDKKAEMMNSAASIEARIKSVLKNELAWLARGARARMCKQKAHVKRIEILRQTDFSKASELELSSNQRRLGKKIIELKGISKSFDSKTILKPFSYAFKKNERIGIIGPNGSGKTTFLNMISRRLAPDSGEIDAGINTFIGYFDQHSSALDEEATVIEFARKKGEMIQNEDGSTIHITEMLERFLFPPQMQYAKIKKLSGGERRRLYLLSILLQNPNFLIFDEPTNDLDIKTLSILEDFLTSFNGCLVIVSHDRYFMDRLIDYIFIFDGAGNIDGFPGNFTDYLEYKKECENSRQLIEKSEPRREKNKCDHETKPAEPKKKLNFNERKEYENILSEIEKLENEKAHLEDLFKSGESDSKKLSEWTHKYDKLQHEIAAKIERWEYLAAIADF